MNVANSEEDEQGDVGGLALDGGVPAIWIGPRR